MTSEDSDTVSIEYVPEADGAIGRPSGHVVGVGMEPSAGDVGQVTGKYSQWLIVICRPQTSGHNK